MKLRASQRTALAERICRRWIRRRKLRLRVPPVYLIVHPDRAGRVSGTCYYSYLVLHVGPTANRRDQYILLCHEFAHYLEWHTTARRYRKKHHGERFQRVLWGLVPYGLWKRASQGRWIVGGSKHRPEFQPDRPPRDPGPVGEGFHWVHTGELQSTQMSV